MKTKQEYEKVIADYIRFTTGIEGTDREVIDESGGGTLNEIVADFEDGRYLYLSIDDAITVYVVIDTRNLRDSISAESTEKADRTVSVRVQGGVVDGVDGLPPGWGYVIDDLD